MSADVHELGCCDCSQSGVERCRNRPESAMFAYRTPLCLGCCMPIRNVLRCKSVGILATNCLASATHASFGSLSSAHIRSRALPSCPAVLRRSLHSNKLVQLPDELGCATGLVWLSLNTNSLTRLPESVGQLTNMVRISLVSDIHCL